MNRHTTMPIAMGAMMGLMILWMMHGQMTGQGAPVAWGFVLAHVAVIAVVLGGVAMGLHRRFPRLAGVLRHRPSGRHVALMLGSAVATAFVIHLLHGGPV